MDPVSFLSTTRVMTWVRLVRPVVPARGFPEKMETKCEIGQSGPVSGVVV
jgi:hypothetical protein